MLNTNPVKTGFSLELVNDQFSLIKLDNKTNAFIHAHSSLKTPWLIPTLAMMSIIDQLSIEWILIDIAEITIFLLLMELVVR